MSELSFLVGEGRTKRIESLVLDSAEHAVSKKKKGGEKGIERAALSCRL